MAEHRVTVDKDEAHQKNVEDEAHLASAMGVKAGTVTRHPSNWTLSEQWRRIRLLRRRVQFSLLALVSMYPGCVIWVVAIVSFHSAFPNSDEYILTGCIAGQDYTFGTYSKLETPSCKYSLLGEVSPLLSRNKNSYKPVWDIRNNETQGLLTLYCNIVNIDFVSGTVSVRCQTGIYGTYRDRSTMNTVSVPQGKNANSSLVVVFGEQQSKYRSGDVVQSFVVTSSFIIDETRSIFMYPMMFGRVFLSVSAFWLDPDGSTHDAAFAWKLGHYVPPPYSPLVPDQAQLARPYNRSLPTVFVFSADLELDVFCKAIAIILILVVWVTVLFLSVKAWTVTLRGEETRYDLLAACGALLFALPAMRDMMPGYPPLGILMDLCTILWQLIIVCILFLIFLFNRAQANV
eukprot:TRINITY_DN1462_c0_g1_i1.p1 TRINITY_DN1462_c0_g1~~TRINITY_DN1462_c0_g1_i1.p1  ORF type:complete len:402 (+),score=0.97 TRINITY_DN1462_c0_g1_i1:183-1388(+)